MRIQRIGGAGNSIKTVWHPIFLTGRNQTIVNRFQPLSRELCFHIGLAHRRLGGLIKPVP